MTFIGNGTLRKWLGGWVAGLLCLTAIVAVFGVSGCKQPGGAAKPEDVDYYTCTMHPSVRSQDPKGKCPICSMDLVPVMKKGAAAIHDHHDEHAAHDGAALPDTASGATDDNPAEFTVPMARQQLIGVTYASVEKQPFHHSIRAVGVVAPDKQRHWDYVARVDGYIRELFVFSRGEIVEKDAPLLAIYSPDLLATENEFIDLLAMADDARSKNSGALTESTDRLLRSARQRLHLWNITDSQIAGLEKDRKPMELLTLRSPFRGVVQDIPVDQGRRVMTGDHLVDVADLSAVWVWAQFYEDELSMLKRGLAVTITSAAYPGEKFEGKIAVLDPFLNEGSRTARVRIDVQNPDFHLRPDMYVDAELAMDMGEALGAPVSAVLPTGRHNIVFVDKGAGRLEPRFVELGSKVGDYYQIKSGLKEHERVVTSANFLIDAEAKVQGALKSW
jgi:Cu(I)/Ag(I) efflux system membrane fusion protein